MGEDIPHGQSRPEPADLSSESGWVTTDVAARAVRVSPRTIRRYIDQGKLEAKPEGEGVHREWFVSVDSLHALRATRTLEEQSPRTDRASHADFPADSIADVLREMAARLERRAEEAAELRVRLELTERAQSTLEAELAEANSRREEAERELEELRRYIEDREEAPESPESPVPSDTPTDAGGETQATFEDTQEPQEERKGWFRRFFGL
jgi:DNA-binding transcriptional MerR regulator